MTGSNAVEARLARKAARLMYRWAGIESELVQDPYREPHHRTRSAYIHIPKTAGNSVTKLVYGTTSEGIGGHVPAVRFLDYSPAIYARYLVFATVRHPWDRLQSAYHFLKRGGKSEKDRQWAGKNLSRVESFSAFVQSLSRKAASVRVMRYKHFVPQTAFISDSNGAVIVPRLVKVENFESGMMDICRELDIPFAMVRENAGDSDTASRSSEWSAELEAICHVLYRRDYDVLGYRPKIGAD